MRNVTSSPPVRAICSKDGAWVLKAVNMGQLNKTEFMRALFDTLDKHVVGVDLVSTSMSVASVVLDGTAVALDDSLLLADVVSELETQKIGATVQEGRSIVSCVGEGMRHLVGIAAEIVKQVHYMGTNIEMLSQSNTELNVSVVVKAEDADNVVNQLYAHFIPASNQ